MVKLLKYSHPAVTKYDINKSYSLDELKKELSIDEIKILFQPIGWDFKELNPKVKKLIDVDN